ncbi:MAG: hypothetical protein HY720_09720 [Planctomycetes bacterium]|nr:hypothetical protein [Planctomycetota bacterium]
MTEKALDARPIPKWAAGLLASLSRDRPAVVNREHLASYLAELAQERDLDQTVRDLQQLGWLATLHLKGVWAFVPAGESRPTDPYLDLRGWRAREPDAVFALAGEAAAWHLGYVTRWFDGPPALWLPPGERVPHGLRPHVSLVRLGWAADDARRLGPTPKLLRKKGLDLTAWAGGLPALGPDALLVQLAARPGSFRTWADLVGQLDLLLADCDLERLAELLAGQSASAWQRAAYLLDRGGQRDAGLALLTRRPNERMPAVSLGEGSDAVWSSDYRVNDRLVAPLQQLLGKA